MKTKSSLQIAVVRGAAFAVVTGIYLLIGGGVSGYLWCVYLGFFLTMAFGARTAEMPHYLCSYLVGYIWSVPYIFLPELFQILIPNVVLASVISEFLLTGTLLFVHLRFLHGTWFGKVPAVFAAVATVFASGGLSAIPFAAVSGCVGILMAMGTGVILSAVQKDN